MPTAETATSSRPAPATPRKSARSRPASAANSRQGTRRSGVAVLKEPHSCARLLRNLAAIFASHPNAERACRVTGITNEQAAAFVLDKMAQAPTARQRDQIFSNVMGAVGIFTSGVEAFDRGSEEMLERMGSKHAEREAQRMSEESRRTPHYSTPERILAVRQVAQQSSLQQGLSDRMRASDELAAKHAGADLPSTPRVQAFQDDERDRRSALNAAIASSRPETGTLPLAERATLRETLSAAFDAHAAVEEDRDPLADERLLSMSDAI